jgi:deoxyribodipyrimidine photo-lyase
VAQAWKASPALRGLRPDGGAGEAFQAWATGHTGWPFLDACMRSLIATGWLNFRMRAMLVSVATCHLWMDWRAPGEHLARLFTDYEPGIHWPQVQMQSGATGVNTVRLYNPVKQGFDQDPAGVFIRRWVPELAGLEAPHVHTPWLAPAETLAAAGVRLGRTYPHPIADHANAARLARERLWGARRGAAYRAEADRIQAKHGSRKSGMHQVGDRPAKILRRRRATQQTTLDL